MTKGKLGVTTAKIDKGYISTNASPVNSMMHAIEFVLFPEVINKTMPSKIGLQINSFQERTIGIVTTTLKSANKAGWECDCDLARAKRIP